MASPSSPALVRRTQARLQTRRLGRPMEGRTRIDSTNARALAWAADGTTEGSTVVAELQTAGRGRHGRRWSARAGQNLTFSVVLRPTEAHFARDALPSTRLGLVALVGGLAVCEALAGAVAPLTPSLKWPNDVLLGGRKCCGILAESSSGMRPGPAVLGIGLNVNQDDFPDVPEAGVPPTSLLLEAGRPLDRAALLASLLEHLETHYLSLFIDGGRSVRRACEAHLTHLGERVTVRATNSGAGKPLEGIARGLAPDGALRIETERGDERTVHAGDVTTRR